MMKKTALLLFLMAVSLVSCKKQYTCRCTVSVYDYNQTVPHVFKSESAPIAEKMTQKQAEDVCQHQQAALNATYRNLFYDLTFSNTLGARAEAECKLQ
jgi:hypothetical protein